LDAHWTDTKSISALLGHLAIENRVSNRGFDEFQATFWDVADNGNYLANAVTESEGNDDAKVGQQMDDASSTSTEQPRVWQSLFGQTKRNSPALFVAFDFRPETYALPDEIGARAPCNGNFHAVGGFLIIGSIPSDASPKSVVSFNCADGDWRDYSSIAGCA
jgi:hypothetical protein